MNEPSQVNHLESFVHAILPPTLLVNWAECVLFTDPTLLTALQASTWTPQYNSPLASLGLHTAYFNCMQLDQTVHKCAYFKTKPQQQAHKKLQTTPLTAKLIVYKY